MTRAEALRLAQVRWPEAAQLDTAWWDSEQVRAWHVHREDNAWLGNVEAFTDQGTWTLTPVENIPERWSREATGKLWAVTHP
jgi:hypothetical protein